MNEARSILLADDDAPFRERLAKALRKRGFEVREAADASAAMELAREESPEWALVDLRMPGESGLELVKGLNRLDAATRIVVLTGYGSIATALEATRLGAAHYLTKPADLDEILSAFERGPGAAPLPEEAPSLAWVEWEHIQRVLSECQGNISQAAKVLGLHRRSLQRKLAKPPAAR